MKLPTVASYGVSIRMLFILRSHMSNPPSPRLRRVLLAIHPNRNKLRGIAYSAEVATKAGLAKEDNYLPLVIKSDRKPKVWAFSKHNRAEAELLNARYTLPMLK